MFKQLSRDCGGGVAILFGLSLFVIALTSGFALDYSRAVSTKEKNQQALDAAVLAAVVSANNQGAAQKAVADFYTANGGLGVVTDVNYSEDATGATVSALSSHASNNAFGGLLDIPKTAVQVTSVARGTGTLSELTIEPVSAGGAWSKTMTLHKVDQDTGVDSIVGHIDYEFGLTLAFTGTMTTDMYGPQSIINAKEVYFQMDIDDDPARSWYTDLMSIKSMQTSDPETSYHVFVDGKQLEKGVAVNLADIIPCGQKVRIAWEDGGNFATQDFFFDVTGKCTVSSGSEAHLTK